MKIKLIWLLASAILAASCANGPTEKKVKIGFAMATVKEERWQRDRDLFLVHDRTDAINFAIKRAQKGDTVLLLGKGHEKTIERANGANPWNEIAIARSAAKVAKR